MKQLHTAVSGAQPPNGDDRRVERRYPASGTASLIASLPIPRTITGELVDKSSRGFRAILRDPDLMTGDRVSFTTPERSGIAIVVWRRILETHIECAFLIE